MTGIGGGGFAIYWLIGMLLTLLIFVSLILLAVWLVVRLTRGASELPPSAGSSALAIPQERYARGEIKREDYEQIRSTLEGRGRPPAAPYSPTAA
ncbi:MAG: electron transporter RnfE [Pseudonocardiales bacterium]|nr:MAG: electron transporter RnfE [Pseudonocardiales bacterium]